MKGCGTGVLYCVPRGELMKALVVIDMQNDFIDGALGTAEAVGIVEKVKRKIEQARKNGDKIIFTRDTHEENYLATLEGRKLPVPHCISGTHGWQISDKLDAKDALIFDKPTFGSTALAQYLAEESELSEIELCGLCTDICVISNAMLIKAYLPETTIKVDSSCCAGVTPQSHRNALEAMKMCQIEVV